MNTAKYLHFLFFVLLSLSCIEMNGQICPDNSGELITWNGSANNLFQTAAVASPNICPFQEYTITNNIAQDYQLTGNDIEFWDGVAWVTQICLQDNACGAAPCNEVIFRVNQLGSCIGSGTPPSITLVARAAACGTVGTSCSVVQEFAIVTSYITNTPDMSICAGDDLTIDDVAITCTGYTAPTGEDITGVAIAQGAITVEEFTLEWYDQDDFTTPDQYSTQFTKTSAAMAAWGSSFKILLKTRYQNAGGGLECVFFDSINVIVNETPTITSMTPASTTMCVHDSVNLSASISGVTDGETVSFLWEKATAAALIYSNLTSPDNPGGTPVDQTVSSGTATDVFEVSPERFGVYPAFPALHLVPDDYVIRVTASKAYSNYSGTDVGTCTDDDDVTLNINDRPAVEIGWSKTGYLGGAVQYTDDVEICLGSDISLTVRDCELNTFDPSRQAQPNYTTLDDGGTVTDPSDLMTGTYNNDCPCQQLSGGNSCMGPGNFYSSVAWTKTVDLDAPTVIASQTGANRNDAVSNADLNTAAQRDGDASSITYTATVTDDNGCINIDTVSLNPRYARIQFEVDGSSDLECDGQTVSICPNNATHTIEAWGVPSGGASGCTGSAADDISPQYNNANTTGAQWYWTWGGGAFNATVSNAAGFDANNQQITTDILTTSNLGTSTFNVSMTESNGCNGRGDIIIDNNQLTTNLVAGTICFGEPLQVENSSHTSETYNIYSGDCVNSTCSGGTSGSVNGTTITFSGITTSGTYTVETINGPCIKKETISVTVNPELSFSSHTNHFASQCNDPQIQLTGDATGGSGAYSFSWGVYGSTDNTQNGLANTNYTGNTGNTPNTTGAGEMPDDYVNMGLENNSGTVLQFPVFTIVSTTKFPFFKIVITFVSVIVSNPTFTFDAGLSTQDVWAVLEVEDGAGCTDTVQWVFQLQECGVPQLDKTKTTFDAGGATTGSSIPFTRYVCYGDEINYDINVVNPSSSVSYNYIWNNDAANNTSTFDIDTDGLDQDTIVSFCNVYNTDPENDIIALLIDTVIITRGDVNMYPFGDNSATVDTSVCLNEPVFTQANCPDCRGDLDYVWGNNTGGNTPINGDIYDDTTYVAGTIGNPGFNIELNLYHGEDEDGDGFNDCVESLTRQVEVFDLPVATLEYNNAPINSPMYICDGEVLNINLNTSCTGGCSVLWNTTSTYDTLFVNSQGGYYAQIEDANTCNNITDFVIVLEANDGLNAVITGSPSEICNGNDAVLEVAPCIGCQYQWFDDTDIAETPKGTGQRQFNTATADNYYVAVTNAQNCTYNSSLFSVTETSVTIPSVTATTDSICPGSVSTLSTPYFVNNSYQWYLDGNIISGATDTTYEASVSGDYTVVVAYPNGCTEESPIFNLYDATYTPPLNVVTTVICNNETADLYTDLNTNWTYQWFRDGIPIPGEVGNLLNADQVGSHYVEVTTDYLCVVRTDSVDITASTLVAPTLFTPTPTICPGDEVELKSSICTGCKYQFFYANNVALTSTPTLGQFNFTFTPTVTDSFYVETTLDGCTEVSNMTTVIVNDVFKPVITSSNVANVVCDGQDVLLTTFACAGCSYSWLLDTVPALGAINDTFHEVDNVFEAGDYQVAIEYSNGCSDTSEVLTIADGTDNVVLTLTPSGTPAALDSVICNGVGEQLDANPASALVGTYTYKLFLDNAPIGTFNNVDLFNVNQPGVYTVEMTNPQGCVALSNLLPIREVNVSPTLTSRATLDPNSVTANAICTSTGVVVLEVTNCADCETFVWSNGPTFTPSESPTLHISAAGAAGAGAYNVEATQDGCSASTFISIIDLSSSLNDSTNVDTISICDNQSVTLEYAGGNSNLNYRWLRNSSYGAVNGFPINGATNATYIASLGGTYFVELKTTEGCIDTSGPITVLDVARPDGLVLNFDSSHVVYGKGSPIAADGSPIFLNNWVLPDILRTSYMNAGVSGFFTSAPFSGTLFSNAGLSGVTDSIFTPNDSLSGNHLITYHYDSLGCEFTAEDVLVVLPSADVTITNSNPNSVPYEACVGDTLTLVATNLKFAVDSFMVYNNVSNYIPIVDSNIVGFSIDTTILGIDVFYTTTAQIVVPGDAFSSYLMLLDTNAVPYDTVLSPFVLIHNTDLDLSGLPAVLCSNGDTLELFGNPSGGTFEVWDVNSDPISPAAINGDFLVPPNINPLGFTNGSQFVRIAYQYTANFTNGNLCPNFDTVSQFIEVKDVNLSNVTFNKIAVSETQEELVNLVYETTPYYAHANKPNYDISFAGSFTFPAGDPQFFLSATAGTGMHAITYIIEDSICINSITDSIQVIEAPLSLSIPDTMCRNAGPFTFTRDAAYSYITNNFNPGGFSNARYDDSSGVMKVYTLSTTGVSSVSIDTINPNLNNEVFEYDPTQVVGNFDTLVIEYWFERHEDQRTAGVWNPYDSMEYIMGSIVMPLFIEDADSVSIDTNVVSNYYCEDSALYILKGDSAQNAYGVGFFMLYGGSGQYATGDTLNNNVINPYVVNALEPTTTNYNMIYILNGAACVNRDTLPITISKGLDANFTTASGTDRFCEQGADEPILFTGVAADTIWKIGGIPQANFVFPPQQLNVGLHVVALEFIDTFGCVSEAIDSFYIDTLPNPVLTPMIGTQYCSNDQPFTLTVGPSPTCAFTAGVDEYMIYDDFDGGLLTLNSAGAFTWDNIVGTYDQMIVDASNTFNGSATSVYAQTSDSAAINKWLISGSGGLPLVNGHTYKISYLVKAGALDPLCAADCGAKLNVWLGLSQDPLVISQILINEDLDITNEDFYERRSFNYTHISGTGNYYLGLNSVSETRARHLFIENIRFRDITQGQCDSSGVGYFNGPGIFNLNDSLYYFSPGGISEDTVTLSYVYTDQNLCTDSISVQVVVNESPVASFTEMDSFYCENAPDLMLLGSPICGTFTSSLHTTDSNLVDPLGISSTSLDTACNPVLYQMNVTGTDTIFYTYTDDEGCSDSYFDVVVIVPLGDENIIDTVPLNPTLVGLCENADSIFLQPAEAFAGATIHDYGQFYGPGVYQVGQTAYFYPDSAVMAMGHTGDVTLTYLYSSVPGCTDTTRYTVRIHALPDLLTNIPDSLCLNADTIALELYNQTITGPLGNVFGLDSLPAGVVIFDLQDTITNTTVDPDFIRSQYLDLNPWLAAGHPEILVKAWYTDNVLGGCTDTIYQNIRIDSVPVLGFNGLKPFYCENEPVSIFTAYPSYYVGSGYLVVDPNGTDTTIAGIDAIDSSFYYVQADSLVGNAGTANTTAVTYYVYYDYTDTRGCNNNVTDSFEVRPFERVYFNNDTLNFCQAVDTFDLRSNVISPAGGYFVDDQALSAVVDSFYLSLNAYAGTRRITYVYEDPLTECINDTTSFVVNILSSPIYEFDNTLGCQTLDVFTTSVSNIDTLVDSLTLIRWDFDDGNGFNPYPLSTVSPVEVPDVNHVFNSDGVFDVTLLVTNQGLCTDTITKQIVISPLASLDYYESFETGPNGWYTEQTIDTKQDSLWRHSFGLTGPVINDPTNAAWHIYTDPAVNAGNYNAGENGWVYSPCFDFTTAQRPMIVFDLWSDMLNVVDGVALEYYDTTDYSWKVVGQKDKGVNWFNNPFVLAFGGGEGWSGRSGQFDRVRYRLDQFIGRENVRFRINFASSTQTVIDSNDVMQGAAFDNVYIVERTRNVLVEHFNNIYFSEPANNSHITVDQHVYDLVFGPDYVNDVHLIQYQTENSFGANGEEDSFNLFDRADPEARAIDYGIGEDNRAMIDGLKVDDGKSTELSEYQMDYDMLQFPDFQIDLTVPTVFQMNEFRIDWRVTALVNKDSAEYAVHTVYVQDDSVVAPNTNFVLKNVMREMLPDAAGHRLNQSWNAQDQVSGTYTWNYFSKYWETSFDPTKLEAIVFIQNMDTREVFQVASTRDFNKVGLPFEQIKDEVSMEITELQIAPNPSSDLFNVQFSSELKGSYNWRVIDVTGRVLQTGVAEQGTKQFAISAERLTNGAYFFVIESDKVYAQRKLVVIK